MQTSIRVSVWICIESLKDNCVYKISVILYIAHIIFISTHIAVRHEILQSSTRNDRILRNELPNKNIIYQNNQNTSISTKRPTSAEPLDNYQRNEQRKRAITPSLSTPKNHKRSIGRGGPCNLQICTSQRNTIRLHVEHTEKEHHPSLPNVPFPVAGKLEAGLQH